jgi:hypothetical protein
MLKFKFSWKGKKGSMAAPITTRPSLVPPKPKLSALLISSLIGLLLLSATGPLVLAQSQPLPSSLPELKTLLVGASGPPQLLIRPGDNKLTYLTTSSAYGVVAGSETGYTALGSTITPEKLGTTSGAYDETGTLNVVWSERPAPGQGYQLYFNVLTRDGKTGKATRFKLEGQMSSSLAKPKLAYSALQRTLFLLYVEKGTPTDALWVISSSDKGLSWTKPLALGLTLSNDDPTTELIVDVNGNPQAFFVVAGRDPKVQLHHRYRLGQNWSPPIDVSEDQFTELNYIQASPTASGEVWVSWLSEQGIGAARRDHDTGRWLNWPLVTPPGTNSTPNLLTLWPSLAVGEEGKSAFIGWVSQPKAGDAGSQLKYVQTGDGGKHWQNPRLLLNLADQGLSEAKGLSAITRGDRLDLAFTTKSREYQDETTLYLLELKEGSVLPATPTPPLLPTATPTQTQPIIATPTELGFPSVTTTVLPSGTQILNTPTPTVTNLPTSTASPTATKTPPLPTQVPAQNGFGSAPVSNQGGGSGQLTNQPNSNSPQAVAAGATASSTIPGPTLDPAIVTATAYAAIQNEVARTPIIVAVPTQHFKAQGPMVLPATATPSPLATATLLPTSTPLPTNTALPWPTATQLPATLTAQALKSLTAAASANGAPAYYYQYPNSTSGGGLPLMSLMLSGLGLLLTGKGLLNWKARHKGAASKAKSTGKKQARGPGKNIPPPPVLPPQA